MHSLARSCKSFCNNFVRVAFFSQLGFVLKRAFQTKQQVLDFFPIILNPIAYHRFLQQQSNQS